MVGKLVGTIVLPEVDGRCFVSNDTLRFGVDKVGNVFCCIMKVCALVDAFEGNVVI